MMKRLKKAVATGILMIVSILCLALAACGSDNVTLQFEANGGAPVAAITAKAGDEVELPVPDAREGYEFIGWFENAEGTGEAVTKVVAETDKTYYAKWEKLYKITFALGAGQMDISSAYLRAGTAILSHIQDHVPTMEGWQFGEWTLDGKAVSSATAMPEEDITLTARYKVGYTVHVNLQNTALDGYEAGEDIKGYDYPTASYTPDVGMKGFEVAEDNDETTHELFADPARNVFTFNLNRKHYNVILFPNYPNGAGGETVSIDYVYGVPVEFPYAEFEAEGYLLKGWADTASEKYYASQVLEGLLRNGDGIERKDTFTLEVGDETEIMLYADWEQGYSDLLGGDDLIFYDEEEPARVVLLRCDDYYEGTYIPATNLFRFTLEDETLLLEGKLFEGNRTFAYYDEMREGLIYQRYQVGLGISNSERITLDSYNGLTYTRTVTTLFGTEESVSKGTYYMNDDLECIVTYTSGDKAGATDTLRLGIATVNGAEQRVFQARAEEDIDRGTMHRYNVINNAVSFYPSAYLLTFDGFGIATMQTGTSTTNYYYVVSGETFRLLTSSGTVYGTYKFVQFGAGVGYMSYNSTLDREFTGDSGTLKLDGACNAEYTHAGITLSGYYSAIDSNFGGVIITMTVETGTVAETYVFRAYSTQGDGDTTLFTFEEKDAGYAEYLYVYQNDQGTYRSAAPLLVIDDEKEGLASLYGYTETGVYVKVAEGTITPNGKDGTQEKFLFTVTQHIQPETAPRTEPYDLSKIESFVYSTGVASDYNVAYWYSVKMTGETDTVFDEQYRNDTAGSTLTLVSGFAVYSRDGADTAAGVYSTMSANENVIRMTVNNTTYYFELNKESKEFIHLDNLYGSKVERLPSGSANSSVTLFLDGKGGATLTTTPQEGDPTVVEGSYEKGAETKFGTQTYHFTATGDDSKSFDFILLSSTLTTYFARSAGAKTYTAADGAQLELDGYSYTARYTDAQDTSLEGRYTVSDDAVTFTSDDVTFHFDLKENTFTVRGSEAGEYLRMENQYIDGTVYVFEGYTKLTVRRIPEGGAHLEDVATGTYEENGDGWILHYREGDKDCTITGRLGVYLISSTRGYRVFKVEQEEIEHKYIDESDWSVLIPDGHGDATLYTASGVVESGTYLIIEDSEEDHLLYYANSAGTDACLYRFDSQKGTIEKISVRRQHGYYTTDLRSLRFTQYGFMIMDGATRFYYTVAANGNITVYERDPENERANEYGFVVTKDIGTFEDDTIEFNGRTYINNDGFNILFDREEATQGNYPISATDSTGKAIKGPFRQLSFQPTGEAEFSVTGAVEIAYTGEDGTPASGYTRCTVVREQVEDTEDYILYVTIGYYRFEITVNYRGETGNTYTVDNMKYMRTLQSDRYLNNLYLIYMLYGSSYGSLYPNTFGQFTLVQEFDTAGEMAGKYLDVTFGETENIRQADGKLITELHGDYTEENGIYSISLEAEDGYTYNFYFGITANRYFSQYSFILCACTRVQTLVSGAYTVEVERIVATDDTSVSAGEIWDLTLKQGDEEISLESIYLLEDKIYCIARTREALDTDTEGTNTGKITGTVYYELVLVEKKASVEDEGGETQDTDTGVAAYASVTVTKRDVKTIYCADGVSYVDIFTGDQNQVAGFVFGTAQYFVKETQYDAGSNTYTVTTIGNAKYTIKVETKEGAEQATITLIPEEEEGE